MLNLPNQISVFGAGSWGTALANLLSKNNHQVTLWSHRKQHIDELARTHVNQAYLPDIPLCKNLNFESDLKKACDVSEHLLLVVPSHAIESLLQQLQQVTKLPGLCWAIKGIEPDSEQLISERVQHYFPGTKMAMLTGPSFAKEVIQELPTAVSIASDDQAYANQWAEFFRNDFFRVYLSDDLIAAQIAGAVKNVLAIACGIADGLKLGANTRAAVITRGLAEMTRLGVAMGSHEKAFSGLAGVGDLVLTCTDNLSRNRRMGLLLGQGRTIDDACDEIGQVVEGLHNAKQVFSLAKKFQVELPICFEVANIVMDGKSAKMAVTDLLKRDQIGMEFSL